MARGFAHRGPRGISAPYAVAARRAAAVDVPTSFIFPGVAWHWAGNLPTLGFSTAATIKTWVWQRNAPSQDFASAIQQKAWVWNHQAPLQTFFSAGSQLAWVWAKNAPLLGFAIVLPQKAWRWFAQGFTSPGVLSNALQYLYWVFGW